MTIVVVDAGHGGQDPGGHSLGAHEKDLALRHALAMGEELARRGLTVHQTRTTDTYPSLEGRASLANRLNADLFISVHANASDNPNASGPWTIYARGSEAGEKFARAAQWAMASVYGGKPDAAYPDESPWVGNRKLAVLRQTMMPAILLELGFMTNERDIEKLEDPEIQQLACTAVAAAIASELGVTAPDVPNIEPALATEPKPKAPPLNLERIEVPTREHVSEIIRVRQFAPDAAAVGLSVAEVFLRGVVAAMDGDRKAAVKVVADSVADWLKERAT